MEPPPDMDGDPWGGNVGSMPDFDDRSAPPARGRGAGGRDSAPPNSRDAGFGSSGGRDAGAARGRASTPGGFSGSRDARVTTTAATPSVTPSATPSLFGDAPSSGRAPIAAAPSAGPVDFFSGVTSLGTGAAAASDDNPDAARARRTLATVRDELGDCQRCKLAKSRNKIVFGTGAADAPLIFVGEAPGADEDRTGEPFVGRAGQLLDKMIDAMGWSRQSVYIANLLKCRPPGNRNPEPDEATACRPFLIAQLDVIAPRIIVALGRPSANALLSVDAPIGSLRGKFHERMGLKIMPTFHPAYLLREPNKKREAWADLQLVMNELARIGVAPRR